jgi:hypothetical protein
MFATIELLEKNVRQRKIFECFLKNLCTLLFEQSPVHRTIILKPKVGSCLFCFGSSDNAQLFQYKIQLCISPNLMCTLRRKASQSL